MPGPNRDPHDRRPRLEETADRPVAVIGNDATEQICRDVKELRVFTFSGRELDARITPYLGLQPGETDCQRQTVRRSS